MITFIVDDVAVIAIGSAIAVAVIMLVRGSFMADRRQRKDIAKRLLVILGIIAVFLVIALLAGNWHIK